ncbi:uncharacterized protein LOC114308962 [Camellia sinensis]|uniref:uncharacterized protein LOC114308962 n=1 Tax=Camellia sinensis TaxID=4442 RepID=UPI001035FB63|nr:uncharacterized protein LOC114308962 [Camellia sinensis]
MESLPYLLCLSALFGESVLCSSIYHACEIQVGDATLFVDLLPLDIWHFDVILGMDWLSKYCATVDCVTKRVLLRPPRHDEVVFVDDISVVREFVDVFLEELSWELVDREIEFTIEVVLSTQTISKTPYRMSTTEKKELKEQPQDLLDEGFIQPSTLP